MTSRAPDRQTLLARLEQVIDTALAAQAREATVHEAEVGAVHACVRRLLEHTMLHGLPDCPLVPGPRMPSAALPRRWRVVKRRVATWQVGQVHVVPTRPDLSPVRVLAGEDGMLYLETWEMMTEPWPGRTLDARVLPPDRMLATLLDRLARVERFAADHADALAAREAQLARARAVGLL